MERKESCHIRSLSFTPLSYFLNLKQHMPRQPARQLAHQQWTMHGIPRSSRLLLQLNYSSISHERRKQASKQASKESLLACCYLSKPVTYDPLLHCSLLRPSILRPRSLSGFIPKKHALR
mmetsp:Transcript_2473/g.3783  ORF Transcript_2473/g.3783 Transcript_2473/m.3783 type:complete len:120 (+) Transcript_2473:274-633(+)